MFELTKDVIDDIVFAMEDQEGAWQVDIETGGLIAKAEACGDGEAPLLPQPVTVSIPAWSPREGFKLMENFAAELRQPSARRSLHEALALGRGVFKAFKERLTEFPEAERAFRDKKLRVMSLRIREWYDDLREASGLERLGTEPEDVSELLASDLGFSSGLASACGPHMKALLKRLADESIAELPEALVRWHAGRIERELGGEDWVGVWVEDGEGGAVAGAAGVPGDGRSPGRIFFVAVDPDFRRKGIASALVDRLSAELGGETGSIVLLDVPLLLPAFEKGLFSSGFTSYGTRAWVAI